MNQFKSLQLRPLPGLVSYFEPNQEFPARVKEDSPAVLVMTDLRQQIAVTIEPNVSIDWALQRMKTSGVRLLFVVNSEKEVVGLITSTDIQGEKPLQFRKELNLRYEEIMVRDIMTPRLQLEVISMEDVLDAAVGDVVKTLVDAGRHHALVIDDNPRSERPAIRGIFSLSQVGRQLGRMIELSNAAQTFAEMGAALNG